MQLQTTIIKFPDIKLQTRDAHKLRGYFGDLFKEQSELLHNHYTDGTSKYKYPLVQYKVIDKVPFLVGIEDGGKLLTDLFFKITKLNIKGINYSVYSKHIQRQITEIGDFAKLNEYRFKNLWMGLNQKNHKKYLLISSQSEKKDFLNKQLQNNILSFYKGIGFRAKERIMVTAQLQEKSTKFKNKNMLAFNGNFVTNAVLPDLVGIGKSVSRGFGTIMK